MVNIMRIKDNLNLQKYIYLLSLFIEKKIEALEFEKLFLQTRREDTYWLSGSFDIKTENILNELFLDIDEFTPPDLSDQNDQFSINEDELITRSKNAFTKLVEISQYN